MGLGEPLRFAPMTAHVLMLVVLLGLVSPSAHAQRAQEGVRPPRALLERMMADLHDYDELMRAGIDSLAKWITVERRDFNGDGVREWVVVETRVCGSNSPCTTWIYRRLPGGRFVQVHEDFGLRIDVLPARSHGWHHVTGYWYRPCCASQTRTFVFDGRRYRWRETRYEVFDEPGEPGTKYRVFVTAPEEPGPRRLALDPFNVGGGLWISARYDICRAARARTGGCDAPRLILSSARLPAGRVCVRMYTFVTPGESRAHAGSGGCGVTSPDPGAPGRRRLVLRPAREVWARLRRYPGVELTGPGLPGKLRSEDADGLAAFAGHLEEFDRPPCVEGNGCAETDRQ